MEHFFRMKDRDQTGGTSPGSGDPVTIMRSGQVSPLAMRLLQGYDWPGKMREHGIEVEE